MRLNHKLTSLQRLGLTVGSSIGALVNPLRGGIFILKICNCLVDLVATLGETTGLEACRRMRDLMLHSPQGRQILWSRPRVSKTYLDFDKLRTLPLRSLGKQHFLFFQNNGISPDTRHEVVYIDDEELAFVMQRYRDNHDILHTLCGLSISVVAELALKHFEYAQTRLPMTYLGSKFGPLALSYSDRRDFFLRYRPWAEKSSAQCAFYMNFNFEELLSCDIDRIRKQLNLIPFSSTLYTDI